MLLNQMQTLWLEHMFRAMLLFQRKLRIRLFGVKYVAFFMKLVVNGKMIH